MAAPVSIELVRVGSPTHGQAQRIVPCTVGINVSMLADNGHLGGSESGTYRVV